MKFPVFPCITGNWAETEFARDYPLHRRVYALLHLPAEKRRASGGADNAVILREGGLEDVR